MEKIQLSICDPDVVFLEMMMDYIRCSEFADTFSVNAFSKYDGLIRHLDAVGTSATHIALVSSEAAGITGVGEVTEIVNVAEDAKVTETEQTFAKYADCMILVVENRNKHNVEQFASVYKFQSLHDLLMDVLAIYNTRQQGQLPTGIGVQQCAVLSVFSACGGMGKTTVAVNLAKQAAENNMKVFYLNLEQYSSAPVFLPATSDPNGFAKIAYFCKTNPLLVPEKLQLLRKVEATSGFDYIEPLMNRREILQLTETDITVLIDSLVSLQWYDVIVIDLESSLHDRIVAALQISDHIVWLITDDAQSICKTEQLWDDFREACGSSFAEMTGKVQFVLNKHTGEQFNTICFGEKEVSGTLPYIPQWKNVRTKEQLYAAHGFNEQLRNLFLRTGTGKAVAGFDS